MKTQGNAHSKVDAVLFDLDGTLLDTTEAILVSTQHTYRLFTGQDRPVEEFRRFLGLPLIEVMKALIPERAEEAVQEYVKHNLSIHPQYVRAFPWAIRLLETLRSEGVKTALVTAKRRTSAELGMRLTGMIDLFDATVCHEETARSKPHPDPVLRALDLLELKKGRALVVGDSPWDIQAGNSAKPMAGHVVIETVAVSYGPSGTHDRETLMRHNPDHLVTSLLEVFPLAGLNAPGTT